MVSGRLNVTVATPSATSYVTGGLLSSLMVPPVGLRSKVFGP